MNSSTCDFLHLDLCRQILVKLPAKSLVRFRCVCRQWRSMIESREFISEHLATYRDNIERTFLLELAWQDNAQVLESKTLEKTGTEFSYPLERSLFETDFRNHINGVHLLRDENSKELILWNPSIHKHTILPPVAHSIARYYSIPCKEMKVSLGYDGLNDDYKVVVLGFYSYKYSWFDDEGIIVADNDEGFSDGEDWDLGDTHHQDGVLPFSVPVVVGVYSLNLDTWKKIDHQKRLLRCNYGEQIFVKGANNWIGNYDRWSVTGELKERIISFDVVTEIFSYFMVPEHGRKSCRRTVVAIRESLVILDDDHFAKGIHLWVMEEYGVSRSWTRRYTVSNIVIYDLLGLSVDGELMFTVYGRIVRTYNVNTGQVISYVADSITSAPKCPYMESLVLITAKS